MAVDEVRTKPPFLISRLAKSFPSAVMMNPYTRPLVDLPNALAKAV